MVIQIITLAFVVVGGTCGLLIPVLLYILNLHTDHWTWPYAALLGAMLASTDAVAIVAVMKTSACLRCLFVFQILKKQALRGSLKHAAYLYRPVILKKMWTC